MPQRVSPGEVTTLTSVSWEVVSWGPMWTWGVVAAGVAPSAATTLASGGVAAAVGMLGGGVVLGMGVVVGGGVWVGMGVVVGVGATGGRAARCAPPICVGRTTAGVAGAGSAAAAAAGVGMTAGCWGFAGVTEGREDAFWGAATASGTEDAAVLAWVVADGMERGDVVVGFAVFGVVWMGVAAAGVAERVGRGVVVVGRMCWVLEGPFTIMLLT